MTPATSHHPDDQPHPGNVEGTKGGLPPAPPHLHLPASGTYPDCIPVYPDVVRPVRHMPGRPFTEHAAWMEKGVTEDEMSGWHH